MRGVIISCPAQPLARCCVGRGGAATRRAPFAALVSLDFAALKSRYLTITGVKTKLAQAFAELEELGIACAVKIVDVSGHLQVLERVDDGRCHAVQFSTSDAVITAYSASQ